MPRRLLLCLAAGLAGTAAGADPGPPTTGSVAERAPHDPLPTELQGRWVDAADPAVALVVTGGEVVYAGRAVAYDHKRVVREDGALTVSLGVDDPAREDAFQRENLTGLIMTPNGELHGYNVKFVSRFVRPPAP